ncbi:hypothetical protein BJX61DRAFT_544677 [Aspergillus egyptiacus]|nr:hypothetical protein BJX61DRAFT_544677 [Aspergillus egyptiacus]
MGFYQAYIPPTPEGTDFSGYTVIVTGASASLGILRAERKTHIRLTGVNSLHGVDLLAKTIAKLPITTVSVLGSETQRFFHDIWDALEKHNLLDKLPRKESIACLVISAFHILGYGIHNSGSWATLGMPLILLPIHYLSTGSVLHLQLWPTTNQKSNTSVANKEASASFFRPGGDELGYLETHQVGIVTSQANFSQAMVADMLRTGLVPDFANVLAPFSIDFIPVEYMAQVLATLFAGASPFAPGEGVRHSFPRRKPGPVAA